MITTKITFQDNGQDFTHFFCDQQGIIEQIHPQPKHPLFIRARIVNLNALQPGDRVQLETPGQPLELAPAVEQIRGISESVALD